MSDCDSTAPASTVLRATQALRVRPLRADEFDWANARYAEIDFLPSTAADHVAVAEVDGAAAGLGRIVPLADGVGELGGMLVFPPYRGTGVSRAVLSYLVAVAGAQSLYCLPFEHLAALYQSFGFAPCAAEPGVPAALIAKHAWCNAHYSHPVLLLRRG